MDCPQDTIELQAAAPVNTARPKGDTESHACRSNATHGDADSEEPLQHFNFNADSTAPPKNQASSCRISDSSPIDDGDLNPAPNDDSGTGQVSLTGVADSEGQAKPSDPIDAGSSSLSNCRGPSGKVIEPVDNNERNDDPEWIHPHARGTPAALHERASTKEAQGGSLSD